MNERWTRIPQPIDSEADRRTLCGVLTSAGLEARIVRIRKTPSATPKRFVEYRDTGLHRPITEKEVSA